LTISLSFGAQLGFNQWNEVVMRLKLQAAVFAGLLTTAAPISLLLSPLHRSSMTL
jgi:hypothetical protein